MKIGIDLGGSHISVGLIDEDKIYECKQKNFNDEDKKNIKKTIIDSIEKMINEIIEENGKKDDKIKYIGIASPGLIANNTIVKATNLGLMDFNICEILNEKFNVPVKVRNDAKCAALAEKKYGSLKEYDDALFLCIGTGIGGAAFITGRLLEPDGYAGFEFGHMVIEKNGRQCTCGKRGCFETYASIRALKKEVTSLLGVSSDISGQYLRENLLIIDNEAVQEKIENFVDYLKIGLGNLIDIFEPKAICLGGSFAHYEAIIKKLVLKLNEDDATFTTSKKPKIITAKFENDAGMLGAVL